MVRVAMPHVAAFFMLLLTSCAGSKISQPINPRPLPEPIIRIALAPSGGVLADAIGTELFNDGFEVIDAQATSNFLIRANVDEIEILQPKSLATFRSVGIQAVLNVKTVGGYDEKPQSASVRVVSTINGEIIAGSSWQNGWAGAQGSPADSVMRSDLVGAAKKIGKAIISQLRRDGSVVGQ